MRTDDRADRAVAGFIRRAVSDLAVGTMDDGQAGRWRSQPTGRKREPIGWTTEAQGYPPEAVRECLLNAVAHRDWTRPAAIEVVRYSNRLTVTSPGALQNAMTIVNMSGRCDARRPVPAGSVSIPGGGR